MKYFAIINDTQQGPFALDQLVEAGVCPDTYVWCKGMSDWKQAREVADICRFFRIRIFDLMHPSSAAQQEQIPTEQAPAEPQSYRDVIDQIRQTDTSAIETPNCEYPPRTWLIEAIMLTILCFPITGFIAIFHSHRASKLWAENDKEKSHEAARKAKKWCLYTFFLGIICYAFSSKFLV